MFWTNLLLLIRLRWEKFNIFLEGLVFDEFNNVKKQREHNEMKVIDALAEEVEEKSLIETKKKYDNYTDDNMRELISTSSAFVSDTELEVWRRKEDVVHATQDARDLFRGTDRVKPIKATDVIHDWLDDTSNEIRGGYGNRLLFTHTSSVGYDNRILYDEYFPMSPGRILRVVTREYPLMDKCPYDATYRVIDDHIHIEMNFDMPDYFDFCTGQNVIGEKRKGLKQRFSLDKIFILRGNDMDYIKKKVDYNMPYEVFISTGTGLIGCDLLIETYAKPDYTPHPVANMNMPILKKSHMDIVISAMEPTDPSERNMLLQKVIDNIENR